jgi:hypothetical protein
MPSGRRSPSGQSAYHKVWLQENDFFNSDYFAEICNRDD